MSSEPRDLIGLAIDLVSRPELTFDLVEPESAVGRRALRRGTNQSWSTANWSFAGRPMRLLAPELASAQEFLRHSPRFPTGSALSVVRLALQTTPPHLSVTVSAGAHTDEADTQFARWITRLADSALQSSKGGMV
jgi:hypothetical protein